MRKRYKVSWKCLHCDKILWGLYSSLLEEGAYAKEVRDNELLIGHQCSHSITGTAILVSVEKIQ